MAKPTPQSNVKPSQSPQSTPQSKTQEKNVAPTPTPEKKKMNIVDMTPAEIAAREAKAKEAAELEAKKEAARTGADENKKPKATVIQTEFGRDFREGTMVHHTFKLFTLPLGTVIKIGGQDCTAPLTFQQIVQSHVETFPSVTRERHEFIVRRRINTFERNFGFRVGIDKDQRISKFITERVNLGRSLSPEQVAAKAAKEQAKADKKKEKEAAKAAKAAAKEAAAKAKAEAAEKAKAEAAAKAAAQTKPPEAASKA